MVRRGLWALSIALCCGCVASPTTESAPAAITNGTDDLGDPAVVALLDGTGHALCTGTLIAPRVVLTAAHCVGDPLPLVFFGSSPAELGVIRGVLVARLHPDFQAPPTHDLALLLLDGVAAGVAPIPLAPVDAVAVGAPIRLVGFGHLTAAGTDEHIKREGTTTIDTLGALDFRFSANPSQTCVGDSGGPAFLSSGGTEYLAGVTSTGDAECLVFGRDVRVDAYLDFVQSFLDEVAEGAAVGDRCYYDTQCVSARCVVAEDEPRLSFCAAPCDDDGDCPTGLACLDRDGETLCTYPAPSPGALGSPCLDATECLSGLCTSAVDPSDSTCAEPCPCQSGFECLRVVDDPTSACFPVPAPAGCCGVGRRDDGASALVLTIGLLLCWRSRRRR